MNKRNLFFPKFDVFIVANKQDEKCFYEAIENLNNNYLKSCQFLENKAQDY